MQIENFKMNTKVESGEWRVESELGSGFGVRGSGISGEWRVASGECETLSASGFIHHSSFIIHHSAKAGNELPAPNQLPSTIYYLPDSSLPPTAYRLQPSRRGISLLEVLISIFVLAVGLLGVAAIIPLGQMSLWETAKADRAGACGRAALREIEVRRMLDFRYWYWLPSLTISANNWGYIPYNPFSVVPDNFTDVSGCRDSMPIVIDPLGRRENCLPEIFGRTPAVLPRRTLRSVPLSLSGAPPPMDPTLAQEIFFWSDDLVFDTPKDAAARPSLLAGGMSEGSYSWFFTAMPAATEMSLPVAGRRLFTVSVAVCYKRNFDPNSVGTFEGEHTATINSNTVTPQGFPGMGLGGGTVVLNSKINVKENQWVMLYHLHVDNSGNALPGYPEMNRCNWYRVVGVGMDVAPPNGPTLTLVGPDWDYNLPATLVVVPGVIGVYTTTVELDWDPLWTR